MQSPPLGGTAQGGGPPWPAGPLPSAKKSEDFPCLPGYWVCYDKDMMRTTLFLLGALLAAAVHAASSKDATYTRSTAVVVRAHPWLTRGLPRESLIGIRFWGGIGGQYGGPLQQPITFRFQLTNCTREQLGELLLWYLPYDPAPYSWREGLGQMPGTISESSISDSEFTLTYTPRPNSGDQWIYPRTGGRVESDYIWLTAAIDPAISRDAEIRVSVDNKQIRLQDGTYAVDNNLLSDGTVAPHRVYPYKYRNNAYLRALRFHTGSNVFADNEAGRLNGLTDLMLSCLLISCDTSKPEDPFWLNLNTESYGNGLKKLTGYRDATDETGARKYPHLRVFASINTQGVYTIDGEKRTSLGHAAGDKYRARLVEDLVAMMEEYDLDGLDVDWEYPNRYMQNGATYDSTGEFERYGLFLRDLSEAFFNHGWELAMCTNLGYKMPGGEVMAVPDFINSMAYGRPTGLHASYAVMVSSALQGVLLSRNVPKRRILVGQAPYGYEWQNLAWSEIVNSFPGDNGGRRNSRPVTDWDVVVANLDRDTSVVYRTNSQTNTSYNGPTTLRGKCNYARENGYGGVMSWGYYDDRGSVLWNHSDWLSAGRNMAQVVWPHDFWQAPEQAEDGYYLLDSEEDWFWFQENPGHNVRLAADITFTHDPLPIPAFSRTLDGNGHTLTIPEGVWLVTYEDTALIRELSGTVQDLTIVLDGRIVTRNDRKNDWEYADCKAVPGNGRAAVLATSLSGNGVIRNVTVRIGEHGEVQGAKQAGGVVANAWAGEGSGFTLENVRVDIAGWVRNLADPSGSGCGTAGLIPTDQTTVGGLAAWVGGPGANTVRDCAVTLRPTARLSNASGKNDAVAGGVGHFNNAGGTTVEDLRVSWQGASITSQESRLWANSPWVTSFNTIDPGSTGTKALTGAVSVPRAQEEAFREKWPSYWLEATAPLWFPGYRFRLR